jgi:hypothetical protein
MDDEAKQMPDNAGGETIPLSEAAPPFERVESPIDSVQARVLPPPAPKPESDFRPEDTQFSLRGLMVLLTIACCVLGVGSRMRIDIFAGTLGILTLVIGGLMSLLDIRRAIFHLGWWILLGTYVFVCFVAVMQQTKGG